MITVGLETWKTELLLSVRAMPSTSLERNLRNLLHDEVARLDLLASRFRTDSELSAVNAAAGQWVDVSWDFVAVLAACLQAADITGGLVDPTLGGAIKAAGYDAWADQPTPTDADVTTGTWRSVGIRPGGRQAQVCIAAGSALDLGSIAKGWLADRLAASVARSGYEVCANMGGDIRVIADEPWTVWADSEVPGAPLATLTLVDAGLATSGTTRRSWKGGHHIIDPRTGEPAVTDWHSVSAVAANAVHANAAATAGIILGADGPGWMQTRGLDTRFVAPERIATTGRWPQEEMAA